MRTLNLGGSFLLVFFCFLPLIARADSVSLAEWTFPNNPDDAVVDTATPENSTEILGVTGAGNLNFANSGATTNAARATNWQEGSAWTVNVNTVGYQNILVSVKLRSSGTGPRDFALQYRIGNEGAWLDVAGGTILVADNFTTGALEALPLPSAADNQELVTLRLVVSSPQSVNGGVIGTSGANRLDDLIITATPLEEEAEEPEPGAQCSGEFDLVRINEILPYPLANDQEYAELFNSGDQCVNLSGWRLEDSGAHKYIFPLGSVIEPAEYQTLVQNLFLNNTTADALTLYNQENEEVSNVQYEKAIRGLSYSFDDILFRFTSHLTPGSINFFDEEDEEETLEAGSGIIVNEVFPNPLTDEGTHEFIELHNLEAGEKNLKGWSLVDASQKIFIFEEDTLISGNGFLSIPRSLFGFSLNNTGTENITLLDPQGNSLSEVSYSTTQEDFSYSFDGKAWRWTKKVTPGTQNEFSKTPKITVTSGESGYVDIPLLFKVDIKNAKEPYKYSWDFGDERRSTLAEPKHTFTKTGKYKATLTVRSADGVAEKNFTITIKKYPKTPVVITALMANPTGTDTGQEWVEIKNLSRKSVNLTGWKLATGTEDPINHPFLQELTLTPNQTLRLTRKHAAFSLPNTKGTVELRYPNNEGASTVRYEEEEIAEDSICTNQNGRCDFKGGTKKEKREVISQIQEPENLILKERLESLKEGATSEAPTLPTKKEILAQIGKDFNLLMNQIFLDSFLKE